MPAKKNNKTEILADIAHALRDLNTTVQVQTINAEEDGLAYFYDGKEHTPTRRGKTLHGSVSPNRIHANGIKINNDIQIQVKKNTVKSRDGKYDIDMGNRFIIHTPHGELNIPTNDNDAHVLWGAALGLYDDQNAGNGGFLSAMNYMYKYLQDPELRKIAGGPAVEKDTKSKFEKAKAKMAALGIEKTEKLDAYIAQQQAKAQSK